MFNKIRLKIAELRMRYWHGVKKVLANSFPNAKGWWNNILDEAYERARLKHTKSSVDYCNLLFGHNT